MLPPPPRIFSFFLRLLCRHVRRKISADVDGGLSGVSRCADTGARIPIGVSGLFFILDTTQPGKIIRLSTGGELGGVLPFFWMGTVMVISISWVVTWSYPVSALPVTAVSSQSLTSRCWLLLLLPLVVGI